MLAAVAATACIAAVCVLVRKESRRGAGTPAAPARQRLAVRPQPQHVPVQYVQVLPAPQPQPVYHHPPQQVIVVQAPAPPGTALLQRPWAGVANAIGAQMRIEQDPTDRVRMAVDLGGLGGAVAARELVAAVREGVISPSVGAHAIARAGFDAGVTVGRLGQDADPRVRTMAALVEQRLDGRVVERGPHA